jgi:hypothetical protein
LLTVVPLAVPPLRTRAMPFSRIVVVCAVPPDSTSCKPATMSVAPLA